MNEWNGMPPNKEYRGWHWLYLYNGLPIPAYWDDHWLINGQQIKVEDLNPEIKYWGQCLTPSEIEAKNARIAQLEATLRELLDAEMDAIVKRVVGVKVAGGKDE